MLRTTLQKLSRHMKLIKVINLGKCTGIILVKRHWFSVMVSSFEYCL
jgi:hypothetical protein